MKGERAIFGGDKEAIRRYQEGVTLFNEQLLQTLRQKLAEKQADIEAEQGDPDVQRYHAAEAYVVQCQIDAIIKREAVLLAPKKPKRIIVNSRPPRRPRVRGRGVTALSVISFGTA